MSSYDWAILAVGMFLQGMVMSAMLLRGVAIRRYPLVFTYLVVSCLVTVVQISFKHYFGSRSRGFYMSYWIGDFIGTFLVLMVIIHLIRLAMLNHRSRNAVYRGLMLGVLAVGVISFFLVDDYSRGFRLGVWLTEIGRDYYFSAVLLNAILWICLVRSNSADKQVYLLTSGLGLKLTGAAISHALRLTGAPLILANHILVLTWFLSLYVWYIALKRIPTPEGAEFAFTDAPGEADRPVR